MCNYRNLISMYVSSVSVNHQILPFLWDVGALSMLIPMDRLHNSGKSLCGTLFQSQCPSWFWQSHILGCVSYEDISSKFKGSGVVNLKWPIGEDGILWMRWFVAQYPYIYTHDGSRSSYLYGKAALTVVSAGTDTACYDCNPVLILYQQDPTSFFNRANSCIHCRLVFFCNVLCLDFWLPIFHSNTWRFSLCWNLTLH